MGMPNFQAFSLPQKHTESVKITSGRKAVSSRSRKLFIARVVRMSWMLISVVETFMIPAFCFSFSSGRKASQEMYSAPVARMRSANASKE